MIDDIVKSVADKLSILPYVEGVVLGGSRARGNHREDSDIDIGVYYRPELFDLSSINELAAQLDDEGRDNLVVPPGAWGKWVNGGGWLIIGGRHADLILRDIERVEQVIEETDRGVVYTDYQTGHPHGYVSAMYRGELAICKVLYSRSDHLLKLKKRAEAYPPALRKSLIDFFLFEAGFSLTLAKANAIADDIYYVAGHIFRAVSCLNQVLFALNKVCCINEKKAVKLIDSFEHKPSNYAEKVKRIFEALGSSATECCAMTENLFKEAGQLVSGEAGT